MAILSARHALERYAGHAVCDQQPKSDSGVDAVFRLGDTRFVVEVKSSARSDSVARAIAHVRNAASAVSNGVPLLVVPSMGETGAAICEQEGISWIDLNGNASISTDRFHIYVRGRRDRSPEIAREAGVNPFSKSASRVVHALLTNPRKNWRRSELESATELDKGYISKIVAALAEQGYIKEYSERRVRIVNVRQPLVLLDAWRESYKPSRPQSWGLVAAHSGSEALHRVVKALARTDVDYAVSGLGAASHYAHFGSFRRVDVYVRGVPPDAVASELSLGTNERGRNIAFHGGFENAAIGLNRENAMCYASPILTYLDVSHLPERSEEASAEMRRYLVERWK